MTCALGLYTSLAPAIAFSIVVRRIATVWIPDLITWGRLSEVEMRSIVFRDKPLLQGRAFHVLAGRKGVGKGTLIAYWASRVTRGELGPKRNVVWIGSEDTPSSRGCGRIGISRSDSRVFGSTRCFVVRRRWSRGRASA